MLIALITDYLDGLAAVKLDAKSSFGEQADRVSDATLAGVGLLGLIIAGLLPWVIIVPFFAIAAYIEYERHIGFENKSFNVIGSILPVIALFIGWFLTLFTFAYQAYGWDWYYLPLTLLILIILGYFKRHRLKFWLSKRQVP